MIKPITKTKRVTTASITKKELDALIAAHIAKLAGITLSDNVMVEVTQSHMSSYEYLVKLTETIEDAQ